MTYPVLSTSTANTASAAVHPNRDKPFAYGFVQVSFTGTGGSPAIQMQGKLNEGAPWANVGTSITSSGVQEIDILPIMQAVPSGLSGTSAVSVWIAD